MYSKNDVKEFIEMLEGSSLSVLEIKNGDGSAIRLEKAISAAPAVVMQANAPASVNESAPAAAPAAPAAPSAPVAEGKTINSPIVGVFYAAPSPDSNPYVSVGQKILKGDTICIVEAMKCMNEIQSELDGEVTEVLVKDGDLVEYGQPLFRVK